MAHDLIEIIIREYNAGLLPYPGRHGVLLRVPILRRTDIDVLDTSVKRQTYIEVRYSVEDEEVSYFEAP